MMNAVGGAPMEAPPVSTACVCFEPCTILLAIGSNDPTCEFPWDTLVWHSRASPVELGGTMDAAGDAAASKEAPVDDTPGSSTDTLSPPQSAPAAPAASSSVPEPEEVAGSPVSEPGSFKERAEAAYRSAPVPDADGVGDLDQCGLLEVRAARLPASSCIPQIINRPPSRRRRASPSCGRRRRPTRRAPPRTAPPSAARRPRRGRGPR